MLFEAVHKLQPNPSLKAAALLAHVKVLATKNPQNPNKEKNKKPQTNQNKANQQQQQTNQNNKLKKPLKPPKLADNFWDQFTIK